MPIFTEAESNFNLQISELVLSDNEAQKKKTMNFNELCSEEHRLDVNCTILIEKCLFSFQLPLCPHLVETWYSRQVKYLLSWISPHPHRGALVKSGAALLRLILTANSQSPPVTAPFLSHLASGRVHILMLKTCSNNATAAVFGAYYCPRECSCSPADEVTCELVSLEKVQERKSCSNDYSFCLYLTQPRSSSPKMTCKKGHRCKPHS